MTAGTVVRDAIVAAIGIALLVWAVRTQEPEEPEEAERKQGGLERREGDR